MTLSLTQSHPKGICLVSQVKSNGPLRGKPLRAYKMLLESPQSGWETSSPIRCLWSLKMVIQQLRKILVVFNWKAVLCGDPLHRAGPVCSTGKQVASQPDPLYCQAICLASASGARVVNGPRRQIALGNKAWLCPIPVTACTTIPCMAKHSETTLSEEWHALLCKRHVVSEAW